MFMRIETAMRNGKADLFLCAIQTKSLEESQRLQVKKQHEEINTLLGLSMALARWYPERTRLVSIQHVQRPREAKLAPSRRQDWCREAHCDEGTAPFFCRLLLACIMC